MIATLDQDFAALERRLLVWSRDGYPTGKTGSTRGSQISDPTATAVLTPDSVRKDRDRLNELILQAHDIAKEADILRGRYMAAGRQTDTHNRGLTRCGNVNGCPNNMWAAKAGRCLACYEHHRRNGNDRR